MRNFRVRALRAALLGATVAIAGVSHIAHAQVAAPQPGETLPENPTGQREPGEQQGSPTETAPPETENTPGEDVVVTGYRRSLAQSTNAKRQSTNFSDWIFAEDIGKFPDTNIAESFNRIPGITITRDITGEGANVAIRGLGSNFTNVTLNGAPIAISSSGVTDAQGTDRAVDLSFFPTDLFTKLTVNKSYTADLLEGGAAGNVDIRSARPFDRNNSYLNYNYQGSKQGRSDKIGQRGSLIGSLRNDTIGILGGVSFQHFFTDTRGFETIGYTNPNLSAAQCGATTGCNTTGGGNWTIPAVVPVGAGAGLVAGTPINQAFLLANNPGATIQQIDNGLLPRLGRPSASYGTRDRLNAIASVEWQPSDTLHFYVDGLYGLRRNNLVREDMNWIVRNGGVIPLNLTFDKTDCSTGCVVTGGTFANSQFFDEFRPYFETTKLWSINPGGDWKLTDNLKVTIQGNYTRSTFHREVPTVGASTPLGRGNTVAFTNDGGLPTITSDLNLNDPNSFGWYQNDRMSLADEYRRNNTKGVRGDVTWGGDRLNLKVGGSWDDISRRIRAVDNSQAWQNAGCGNNPNVFLPGPNTQPPCDGLFAPGAAPAGYPTYPGFGTGFTTGQPGPVVYQGSLVPNSALPSYLKPGPAGFVTVDFPAFAAATNYNFYHDNAPDTTSSTTGASGGYIREVAKSAYFVLNGVRAIGDNDLRFNLGLRYVHTDQTIKGRVSLPDPRNVTASGATLPDGARYPNVATEATTKNSYDNWLPAANIAYDVGEHAVVRAAFSKTLTRPDPNSQLPGVNFSAPSADQASIGNPALTPYKSTNIDLGFEYYTGREGVVSFNAFRKSIQGFTNQFVSTLPFASLSQYGITYDSLNPTQRTAIDSRGGPDAASVQVTSQVNVPNKLKINGLEFQWVQPLDFITSRFGITGLGFNANATIVDQSNNGPAIAYDVAPYTYNVTAYYEKHGVMLRVSTTHREGAQSSGVNQNGVTAAGLFSANYTQWDFSSSLQLDRFGLEGTQLTFNIANFTDATLRSYFQFENATFTQYKPGRQFLLGIRGSF